MKCPFCKSNDNHVVDSRWAESKWITRRRYDCHICKKRFTTHEGYNNKTRNEMIEHIASERSNNG